MNCPRCLGDIEKEELEITEGLNDLVIWFKCPCGYVSGRTMDQEWFEEEYR